MLIVFLDRLTKNMRNKTNKIRNCANSFPHTKCLKMSGKEE
jgi:hypothetical protein